MTSFMLKEAKRTWAQIHQNLNYPSYISNKKNKFKDTMVFFVLSYNWVRSVHGLLEEQFAQSRNNKGQCPAHIQPRESGHCPTQGSAVIHDLGPALLWVNRLAPMLRSELVAIEAPNIK